MGSTLASVLIKDDPVSRSMIPTMNVLSGNFCLFLHFRFGMSEKYLSWIGAFRLSLTGLCGEGVQYLHVDITTKTSM